MFGMKPRHSGRELAAAVGRMSKSAEAVEIGAKHATVIRRVFLEVLEQMESDERSDGACHLLSSMGHVLLKESGVDGRLCVGEVLKCGDEAIGTFSHSWNDAASVMFDVAIARPLEAMPIFEQLYPTLAGVELPAGTRTGVVYGVPLPLDEKAMTVLSGTLGDFVERGREVSGLDFWWWYERSCRRLGIKVQAQKLARKYRDDRWTHVVTAEGRREVARLGVEKVIDYSSVPSGWE